MAPGTFSVSPNGVGLGDTKTFFRGFKDGQYNMTFDGLPFHDTNDPTHHSWAFFPSQTIGSTVFDRSPGSASSIGPSTSGGSVNMLSRNLGATMALRGTVSGGSFNTKLYDVEFDSGTFGADGRSRLFIDGHEMTSDGYQTYNFQDRKSFSAKYQYAASDRTAVTAFASIIDLRSNTPNQKGATRAQIAAVRRQLPDDQRSGVAAVLRLQLLPYPPDFEYVGIKSELGGGWTIDNKVYTLSYYNKQNYNGVTTITATSATDKLNSYRKYGDLVPLTHISNVGVFRTGLWSEVAFTDRYQAPSDPRTWVDAALPNFHEKFTTTELQPFAEYEFKVTPTLRITPGIKLAYYKQDFTQFADNGKTVGNLNGAASIEHAATYTSWLPSFDAHYLLQSGWSMYGQYGRGQNIPPTSVFDVKNGAVKVLPNQVLTETFQAGSVWKGRRATLDVDAYRIHFDNDYSSTPDPVTGRAGLLPERRVDDQGLRSGKHDPRRARIQRVSERHDRPRQIHRLRSDGAERADQHRDDRPELQLRQLERELLQQAGRRHLQRQRRDPRGGPDRPVQHHQPLPQLHGERVVDAVADQECGSR